MKKFIWIREEGFALSAYLYQLSATANEDAPCYEKVATGTPKNIKELCAKLNAETVEGN